MFAFFFFLQADARIERYVEVLGEHIATMPEVGSDSQLVGPHLV